MLVQFTVVPLDAGESLSGAVSKVVDRIDRSGLKYQFTAMGTIVEGEPDAVWALVRECHELMRGMSHRVSTHIAIDDREGVTSPMADKVQKVESVLGRSLHR